MIFESSSVVHGPLTKSGFKTFCHLCKHCTSVRVSLKCTATIETTNEIISSVFSLDPLVICRLIRAVAQSGLAFSNAVRVRTNLLPILPVVRSHRSAKQLVL